MQDAQVASVRAQARELVETSLRNELAERVRPMIGDVLVAVAVIRLGGHR